MLYGARIRLYRESMAMTQEELAQQTDIVASSISKIEHGTRKVTLEEAVRFAEVFHISLPELAGIPEFPGQNDVVKTQIQRCAQKMRDATTSIMDDLERTVSVN